MKNKESEDGRDVCQLPELMPSYVAGAFGNAMERVFIFHLFPSTL